MSFDIRERSASDGAPLELYDFYRGVVHWRYTNADREIHFGGVTWKPIAISRGEIEQGPEIKKIGTKIKAPRTIELYDQFRVAPPGSAIGCTIFTYHYGDGEGADKVLPEWTGRIISVVRKESYVELVGEPAYLSMKTMGLRRNWQRSCPHVLYGKGCKVVKELYKVDGTVQDIVGITLTVPEAGLHPDFYFEGGFVEWTDAQGFVEYRTIESHIGQLLTVSYSLYKLIEGQSVRLYPGCDHTTTMCNGRYGNILNYGGTPYIPQKNPYKGQPVY